SVAEIRASGAAASASLAFPRATAASANPRSRCWPAASARSSTSTTTTVAPAAAATWAMPAPMVPNPTTPTVVNVSDTGPSSGPEGSGAVVGVEAATGLASQQPGVDHLVDQWRRGEAGVMQLPEKA